MSQIEITAANSFIRWNDEVLVYQMNSHPFWTDRVGYLAFVRSWKAVLKIRISEVRKQRMLMQMPPGEIDDKDRSYAQSGRQRLRLQCFNLLRLREACKRRAAAEREQRITVQMGPSQTISGDSDAAPARQAV